MGCVVTKGDGQRASICDLDKSFRPRFFEGAFHAQTRRHNRLNLRVLMLQQLLECLIVLGERMGLLASRRANLGRCDNPMKRQQFCQLGVAHQVSLLIVQLGHEGFLGTPHIRQVVCEDFFV